MYSEKYLSLVEAIKPYLVPKSPDLETLEEPTCPECHAGIERISVGRLPRKTGLRGNPTLICNDCQKQWSFPQVRGGNPPRVTCGLTYEQIAKIDGSRKRIGVEKARPYMKEIGIAEELYWEVVGILRTTPEMRQKIYDQVGKISVETLSRNFGIPSNIMSDMVRGHRWRKLPENNCGN